MKNCQGGDVDSCVEALQKENAQLSAALMRIGEELGLQEVGAFNCIDVIRSMKRSLDPAKAVAWALMQDGEVLQTTHDQDTAAFMKQANSNCVVKPLLLSSSEALATALCAADAVKIARDFGEEDFNGSSDFIRGIAYASESIALKIEDSIRDPGVLKSKRNG